MSAREQYIDKFEITVPLTILVIAGVILGIREYLVQNNIIDRIDPQSDQERWGMTFDDNSIGTDGLSPESKANRSGSTDFEPLSPSDTSIANIQNGYFTATAEDLDWSCGTLKNTDIYKGNALQGVPEAHTASEVFNVLDADGVFTGPFLVIQPDGTYKVPDIHADIFRHMVSGNAACILETQAK